MYQVDEESDYLLKGLSYQQRYDLSVLEVRKAEANAKARKAEAETRKAAANARKAAANARTAEAEMSGINPSDRMIILLARAQSASQVNYLVYGGYKLISVYIKLIVILCIFRGSFGCNKRKRRIQSTYRFQ